MAQRGIREFDGKKMLAKYWTEYFAKDFSYPGKVVLVDPNTKLDDLPKKNKWLKEEKLVVKPDQLFGKRGKHGLIKANVTFAEAKKWIKERMNKDTKVGKVTDKLTHFIIEPFVPHKGETVAQQRCPSHKVHHCAFWVFWNGVELNKQNVFHLILLFLFNRSLSTDSKDSETRPQSAPSAARAATYSLPGKSSRSDH